MVKRISALVLTLALMLTGLTACNNTPESDKISIVVMIFPQYDWVREIIGEKSDKFDVTMLIGSSVDMHSYQPSMMDIARVATADLFIHIGGHSDGWVAGALAQSLNPDMVVINMVEALGDAIVMVEHDCSDDECDDDHHDNDGLIEEEHVWVSLRMARALCAIIAEAIIGLDPENADTYRQNLADYTLKLSDLDARYTEMAEAAPGNTVVFADRFPFLYMMNDYGIAHYAAFSGCSAEAEASFATIVQLSRRIDALELRFVMITETGSRDIAETIINATEARNQQILVLDGMKVATAEVSYLAIMESNLEVLREALS